MSKISQKDLDNLLLCKSTPQALREIMTGQTHDVVGMTIEEVKTTEKYIKGKESVIEWGSGGSTLYFPKLVKDYVSIEHHEGWYNTVNVKKDSNVEFYHVPTCEPTEDTELDAAAHILFANDDEAIVQDNIVYRQSRLGIDWHAGVDYIKKPLELNRKFDVAFIDGRFRIMCCYIALQLLNPNGIVIVHDFNNRWYYHGALAYYDIIEKTESLVVLKPKQ